MIQGAFFKVTAIDQVEKRIEYFRDHLVARLEAEGAATWTFMPDTRNNQMNRYLWGWLYRQIEIAMADGGIVIIDNDGKEYPYTKELLHEMFKETFLCRETIKRGDKERKLYWSTSELSKSPIPYENGDERPSFKHYVDQIREFVSQHWSIEIPDPPVRNMDYQEISNELRG